MSTKYYPIVMTADLRESINFYEDFFDFAPEIEMDCFAVLQHSKHKDIRLGLIAHNHHSLPDTHQKAAQGLIINFPVEDVNKAYKNLYMEGLEIKQEPALAPCGRRHFMIQDPNGVLIDVMEENDSLSGHNDNGDECEAQSETICIQ